MNGIAQHLQRMLEAGLFTYFVNNPATQFGTDSVPFLGATILPEKKLPSALNEWAEGAMRYRPLLAVDSGRHVPITKRNSHSFDEGKFAVGFSNAGGSITSQDVELFQRLSVLANDTKGDNINHEFVAEAFQWLQKTIVDPLQYKVELQRWQAIVNAQIVQVGENGFTRTVTCQNPAGHRFAASASWANDANDPMTDINAAIDVLNNKGFELSRMISSNKVKNTLMANDKMKDRIGMIKIAGGALVGSKPRMKKSDLDGLMVDAGLVAIEEYNKRYYTQTGNARFLADDVLVFIGKTNRDANLDLGDGEELLLHDTLGYSAIGTPAHLSSPGRYINGHMTQEVPVEFRVEAQQATVPVILEPEAIVVITGITNI